MTHNNCHADILLRRHNKIYAVVQGSYPSHFHDLKTKLTPAAILLDSCSMPSTLTIPNEQIEFLLSIKGFLTQ